MPEWLIIVLVFFVVTRLLRSSRRSWHGHPRHLRRARARHLREEAVGRTIAPPKVETPMEVLQRRYVEGNITVEEYEGELDRLFRKT